MSTEGDDRAKALHNSPSPNEGDSALLNEDNPPSPNEGNPALLNADNPPSPNEGNPALLNADNPPSPNEGNPAPPILANSGPPKHGDPHAPNQGNSPLPNEGTRPSPEHGDPASPNQGNSPLPNEGTRPSPEHGDPASPNQGDSPLSDEGDSPSPRRGFAGMFARPVWLEARAPFERRALHRSELWQGKGVPVGDGRPVLIIPGFMSGPHKARQLSHVLEQAGWNVKVAGVGFNAGPAYRSVDAATADLDALAEQTNEPVTIVGHSRGGQFGRVLAVRHPELVRRVIAIGAPLLTKYPTFVVVKVPAEALDKAWRLGAFGHVAPELEQAVDDDRYAPFPDGIDFVSIYSRNDGIVDWRYCFDPAAEMVEITGSHLGLVNSITGIQAIADALPR